MQELRRASRAGLGSVTVIQLTKSAQDEEFGSGDESDSESGPRNKVANLGQLEGTCHNAYGLDGGVYRLVLAELEAFPLASPRLSIKAQILLNNSSSSYSTLVN